MHYLLAVLHSQNDPIEDLLAPYQQNNKGTCPKKYLKYSKKSNSWENPKAQWSTWEVGGRWNNMLQTKDGTLCNTARVEDIDGEAFKKLPLLSFLTSNVWVDVSDMFGNPRIVDCASWFFITIIDCIDELDNPRTTHRTEKPA